MIRPAVPADIPTIAAIYAEAVTTGTASFEIVPPDADAMLRRYETLVADGHPYLVAEHGREVVGFAYAGPYRSRPAYRSTVEDSIYLSSHLHRHGIGRRLLTALIDDATERGFRQMVAVIGDTANTASIQLHYALGFQLVGTLSDVGFKHGRWLDSVIMQRSLGDGADAPPAW